MAEASRRAARPAARGGLPNAMFVVAAAEFPPIDLQGVADELTIILPWGSLLRGALALDPAAAAGIASLVRPGARVRVHLSITERDGLDIASLDEAAAVAGLRDRWAGHGLRLDAVRPATLAELQATGSTWARRLRAGEDRPAWRLDLSRSESGLALVSTNDRFAEAR
jgi:16S rRNA (adenine(1408)-N(1))-methyltransferase